MTLRWSRLIHPKGLSIRGGLRDLISTPARANIGRRRRKLTLNEPSQSTASAQQPRERHPGRCRLLRSANIVSQSTNVRFAFRLSGVKRETTLRKSELSNVVFSSIVARENPLAQMPERNEPIQPLERR